VLARTHTASEEGKTEPLTRLTSEHRRLIPLYRMEALDIQRQNRFFLPFFALFARLDGGKSAAEISFCEELCFFQAYFPFTLCLLLSSPGGEWKFSPRR
jgi:hypothetical protein